MKDRRDLIPGENDAQRGKNVVDARIRIVDVFHQQQNAASRPSIRKVFREAEATFINTIHELDKKYEI